MYNRHMTANQYLLFRFQIAVHNVLLVQIGESVQDIHKVEGGIVFVEMAVNKPFNHRFTSFRFLSTKCAIVLICQDFPQWHVFNNL